MYNNYNQIDKAKHFDFNVGTVNYMAKLIVWSPHVMKVFPHVMHISSKDIIRWECWCSTDDMKMMTTL